jgi:Uncharacterized protein conserved in bacteria
MGQDGVMTETAAIERKAPATLRRRRLVKPIAWVVGVLVVLVGLFFAADAILRQVAQGIVAGQVQQQLPKGIDAHNLSVQIGGFSVIGQYLGGSFQSVELSSPRVTVDGSPIAVRVIATDVPLDFTKPVGHISGTLRAGQTSLNQLVQVPNTSSTILLGDDTVGLHGTAKLIGIPVDYTATVTPSLAGNGMLELAPGDVKVTALSTSVDLTSLAERILGDKPLPLCVAQYLPQGVDVAGIDVSKGIAEARVEASGIVLDQKTFDSRGSCS